ncbi:MAG: HlyD family efflux transporter periplasmic adaptor subunit [Vicinamibacterales bacterium]
MSALRRFVGRRSVAAVGALAALAAVVIGTRYVRAAAVSLPSMRLETSTFVNLLEVRGEIRPRRSIVMTAPSSGSDLQIVNLVRNGAAVAPGDVVVEFDATPQQRTLEQRRSEWQQAQSEVAKVESESRRRLQAAAALLAELQSTAARARLDLGRIELESKVEGDKLRLAVADAEARVKSQRQKLEGERRTTDADIAIVGQKRDKAAFDMTDAQRIIASLSMRSPAAGQISLMPNYRGSGPGTRSAPEFKRGDRAWFGAPIAELPDLSSIQMTCRVDEADRARVPPDAHVRVRVDAIPDREFPGAIGQISIVAKPDFTTFPPTRNFDVSVALDDSDPRVRSGMSATAMIELDQIADVIVVPDTAVFTRNGVSVAYVIDGRAVTPRPVTIARRGRDRVAISSGVSAGERIALVDPTVEARK